MIKVSSKYFIIFIALLSFSFNTYASSLDDFSFGVIFSDNEVRTDVSSLTGTATLDEDDTGYGIYLKFKLSDNFNITTFYHDFGEAVLSGNNGDQFSYSGSTYEFQTTASFSLEAETFGIGLEYMIDLIEGLSLTPKFGVHSWDSDIKVASSVLNGTIADDDAIIDIFYGVGISGLVNESFRVNASYDVYDFDLNDVESINFTVEYIF